MKKNILPKKTMRYFFQIPVLLSFVALSLISHAVFAGGPITLVYTETKPATPSSYQSQLDGKTYQWGLENDLLIEGFEYNGETFTYQKIANEVKVRRVDNPRASGFPCALFAEIYNSDEKYKASYPNDGQGNNNCDYAKVMSGRTLNVGILDLFQNELTSGSSSNQLPGNVERIDFIMSDGVTAPDDIEGLESAGHIVSEKSGNNQIRIAGIIELDAAGNPSKYGPMVTVCPAASTGRACRYCNGEVNACVDFGLTNVTLTSEFLKNERFPTQNGVSGFFTQPEPFSLAFVSLVDLGINVEQKYYGFSLFAPDVNPVAHNLADYTTFPRDTLGGRADTPGDADIYGGTSAYFASHACAFH